MQWSTIIIAFTYVIDNCSHSHPFQKLPHSRTLIIHSGVSKTDSPAWNRSVKRKLGYDSRGELLLSEFSDHAGNAHTDGGEVDEEIHVVDLQNLTAADSLRAEVFVHMGTGYICLFENHEVGILKDVNG